MCYSPKLKSSTKAMSSTNPHSNTHGNSAKTTWSTKNSTSDFRKGMNRDKSHCKELDDEADWDDWKHSTPSTSAAHGCGAVTGPKYVPRDQDELDLLGKCISLCMMFLLGPCILSWENMYMCIKTQEILRQYGRTTHHT